MGPLCLQQCLFIGRKSILALASLHRSYSYSGCEFFLFYLEENMFLLVILYINMNKLININRLINIDMNILFFRNGTTFALHTAPSQKDWL